MPQHSDELKGGKGIRYTLGSTHARAVRSHPVGVDPMIVRRGCSRYLVCRVRALFGSLVVARRLQGSHRSSCRLSSALHAITLVLQSHWRVLRRMRRATEYGVSDYLGDNKLESTGEKTYQRSLSH